MYDIITRAIKGTMSAAANRQLASSRRSKRSLNRPTADAWEASIAWLVVLPVALTTMLGCGSGDNPQDSPVAIAGDKGDGKSGDMPPVDPDVQKILDEMTTPPKAPEPARVWKGGTLFQPTAARQDRGDAAGALWKKFRAAHPFGFQGLAISKIRKDGSCSVVVTEPPPHVTLDQLKEVIPDATVMHQLSGHDGVLFDVIGNLRGGERAILRKLRILSTLLFRTEHGAFVYQEPFERKWQDAKQYVLDLRASAAELQSWIHADGARFVPVEGGEAIGQASLAHSTSSGVYRLVDGNLIVWWIPESIAVSDCIPEMRAFALESDLIVGGLKESGGIMVLARERAAPYELLPPLRAETIALLASSHAKEELAQSYQRRHPAAGMYTLQWDWAPILLSPELVDSEYGDLLNVADQLLKGWSQHGEVSYERFVYPPPDTWAFPTALSKIMEEKFHKATLTFNWNTTGTGYVVPFESSEVYALFRTGALPVSYIPGEDPSLATEVVPYEDTAYDWYATMNNPTLVRVVQYAALYQLFHSFHKDTPTQTAPEVDAPARGFKRTMASFFKAASSASPEDLEALTSGSLAVARLTDADLHEMLSKLGSPLLAQLYDRQFVEKMLRKDILDGQKAWQELSFMDRFSIESGASRLDLPLGGTHARIIIEQTHSFLEALAAKQQLAQQYSDSVAVSGESWIHTPTVVLSKNQNSGAVGGHNVRAATTRLLQTEEMALGRVGVQNDLLRINPADIDRAPSIVRMAARSMRAGESPAILEARLSKALAEAPALARRTPQEVLRIPSLGPSAPLTSARPTLALQTRVASPPASVAEMAQSSAGNRVSFIKHKDVVWVSGPDKLPPVPTSNLADASELASLRMQTSTPRRFLERGRSAEIDFYNFSKNDREILVKEVQSNVRRKGYSQDVVAVVSKERNAIPRFNVKDYDFSRMEVRVEEMVVKGGERFAKVAVEIPAARVGIRGAIIRFLVRFRDAISQGGTRKIMAAIEIRVQEIFRKAALGQLDDVDPVFMMHEEIKRLEKAHGVEIETFVEQAAGDYHLSAVIKDAAPGIPRPREARAA